MLWYYGKQGWMTACAERVPVRRTAATEAVLASATAVGLIATLVWTGLDSQGFATDLPGSLPAPSPE